MKTNKRICTKLMKEIDARYKNANSKIQEVWLHAAETYMDNIDEPIISDDEIEFLKSAFSAIKARGENLDNYTKDELFQVHTILASAIHFNMEDLITYSNISIEFSDKVEERLGRLGVSYI